ncbi:hypothetical protein CCY99_08105 [Helicobacter sp. 16-1353]|uniref:FkbM family methyltransferase n=1 Tax=Helicobacter sp. 16-1353 TaxID=2004996 RepID=UPI000DCE8267|nr:FkbM family methyltransferase [Helicobacter sp. 16-1353]RAX51912.1 hypothetical protein CCY99_08105 [Helicobacter sp. 16-1353]
MAQWGGVIAKNKLVANFNLQKLQFIVENILNDEYSKNLYLSAILNWVSPNKGLFITLYYDHIWKYYKSVNIAKSSEKIIANNYELYLYDLSKLPIIYMLDSKNPHNITNLDSKNPLKIYYSQYGIFINFILEQYAYRDLIRAESGDYVIDGGACYGDTALYFSHLVGEKGRVFAFEFVDENLEIFNKNMALNPHIKNIELVKRPLYVDSKTIVSYSGVGGGARMNKDAKQGIKTISIDDFVRDYEVEKIDFIKFDIEGSELSALKGAKNTIQKFKPKLAICLYHSFSDYVEIPLFLKDLLPEYEFYFDHFTIGLLESVLFAKVKQ